MRARDEVVGAGEKGVDDRDRLRTGAAALLLEQRIGVEQIRVGLGELRQPTLGRIALRAPRDSIPPFLDDIESAIDADALRLVPERVDIGCASGLSRDRKQRKRRHNACGDETALHDTTYKEHCRLGKSMR